MEREGKKMKARKDSVGAPSTQEEARTRRQRSVYNQDVGGFWGRIKAKFDQIVPPTNPPHKLSNLRKHWERIMRECGGFNTIYSNDMEHMPNGENEFTVREKTMSKCCTRYKVKLFKFLPVHEKLKDVPKFRTGMHDVMHGRSVRARLNVEGNYSSGDGPTPIDLSEDNMGPHARTIGQTRAKAARTAKGKGRSGIRAGRMFNRVYQRPWPRAPQTPCLRDRWQR